MSSVSALLIALVTTATPASRGEVIDFSAAWCGPCQQVAPLVARLERQGLPIRKVDVDENPGLAKQFKIAAMPTFVLVVDGRVMDRHEGPMSEAQLRNWIARIPTLQDSVAEGRVVPTSGTATPFVADPNTRLGAPQPMANAFPNADAAASPPAGFPQDEAPVSRAWPTDNASVTAMAPAGSTGMGTPEAANAVAATPQTPVQKDPMASSVRLRVTIDGQINLGSGTIIESSQGQAKIITCGHIFRGINESSRIEVNLFVNGQEQSATGQLVKYDLNADVGLIVIPTQHPLPAIPVARSHQAPQEKESVISIGCSGGQDPTMQNIEITAVNPYLGPENLECTGVPVQGRSGGGLFRPSGELVGICIAADPERKRGVYAGLGAVHGLLKASELAHLIELQPASVVQSSPFSAGSASTPAVTASLPANEPGQFPSSSATESRSEGSLLASMHSQETPRSPLFDDSSSSPFTERSAAPSETPIQIGSDAEDAEIVCIIRPRNQPEAASQVVIVHQASPKLLSYLRGEMGTSAGGHSAMISQDRTKDRSRVVNATEGNDRYLAQRVAIRPAPLASSHSEIQPRHTLQQTSLSARRYIRTRIAQ